MLYLVLKRTKIVEQRIIFEAQNGNSLAALNQMPG
jgi:hypothetical protein